MLWEFPSCLSGREPACNAGNTGLIPESGRSPGGRNGNPLQYSCLKNPLDRGAWRATVLGSQRVTEHPRSLCCGDHWVHCGCSAAPLVSAHQTLATTPLSFLSAPAVTKIPSGITKGPLGDRIIPGSERTSLLFYIRLNELPKKKRTTQTLPAP